MRRTRLICLGIIMIITACGETGVSTPTDPPDGNKVEVHAAGFLFEPDQVRVEVGTTVEWVNDDDILHTVTSGTPASPSDAFDRQLDGRGANTSIVFAEPGEYQYFCSRHPHMTGVVRVDETTP